MTPLVIGYLHVGRREHGVTRYGRVLAAAALAHPGADVLEAHADLSGSAVRRWTALRNAARKLVAADVVHVQYNNQIEKSVWGRSWQQIMNVSMLRALVKAPLVVTVHDVDERSAWPGAGRFLQARAAHALGRARLRMSRGAVGAEAPARGPAERSVDLDAFALSWLQRCARLMLVCSVEEQKRLQRFLPDVDVRVIPHFVEPRPTAIGADAARAALGLTGRTVITLLGYIHENKGHALLVEALPMLPPEVTVVFAGTAEADHRDFVDRLRRAAAASGDSQRLRITGSFIPDAELDVYLAATDLAACPFTHVSASGSLSTWIAAGKPILASDLPLIAEYNRLEPGAIHTFSPTTARALAARLVELLNRQPDTGPLDRLRERLSLSAIVEQHLPVYRQLRDRNGAASR